MEKYIYYDGLKFTRDDNTGYYLNSTIRKRLHRYVWEHERGEIPKGYHIHHKDHDKSNNDISNLVCVKAHNHLSYHSVLHHQEHRDEVIKNLNTIRQKASAWHGSEEGLEWHRNHYETLCRGKLIKRIELKCDQCGKLFFGTYSSRFCSNACKSKWRRDNRLDDVPRVCSCCGKTFYANKYAKAKYCSTECSHEGRKGTHYVLKSKKDNAGSD